MKNISQLTIVSWFASNIGDARIFVVKAGVNVRSSGIPLSRYFGEIFFNFILFHLIFMNKKCKKK